MYFGFIFTKHFVKEEFPSLFSSMDKKDCRKMFLAQYNACVQNELKILPKNAFKYENLYDIFCAKINELIKQKALTCDLSRYLIKAYMQKDFDKLNKIYISIPTNPAAKLIQMIFAKEHMGLRFLASMFFSNYVYDKIAKRQSDKHVIQKNNLIVVQKDKCDIMAVMPVFKYVRLDKAYLANDDIKKAMNIIRDSNYERLFIAYPRHEEFTKHIVVQHALSSKLTLVPYSISNKIVCNSK